MEGKKRRLSPLRALLRAEVPYIDRQALEALLVEYKDPKSYISKLVKQGELIRLKAGFYLIQEQVEKKGIPFEQISNLLYGPSYVSLESALSFYGIIPEAAYTHSAMTLGKAKEFHTKVGTFRYCHLNQERYTIGIAHKENQFGGFFIATPEKALADHVFQLCQGMTQEELFVDLTQSKRIELSSLRSFDKILMQQIANIYRSRAVEHLAKIIINL